MYNIYLLCELKHKQEMFQCLFVLKKKIEEIIQI